MRAQAFIFGHKGEEVTVTLEFPEQADKAAKKEFISRLKAICLENCRENAQREKTYE